MSAAGIACPPRLEYTPSVLIKSAAMLIKRPAGRSGQLVHLEFTSRVLADNPLGDPATRALHVWLPPGYEQTQGRGRGKRFPVMFDLVGFTGSGLGHTAWKNFGENVPERAARLIHERKMGDTILVFADCFTSLGGNQYINSSAVGQYADYLTKELVPFVDKEFRTLASRESRACFGKSSGGYGAIIHGMKYANTWGAIANHSGDAYFEMVYQRDWPGTLNELQKYREPRRSNGVYDAAKAAKLSATGLDDGRIARFLNTFWGKDKASDSEVHALMILAMSATYDPDPKAPNGFRVPYNLETGQLIKERWRAWQKRDPVNLVTKHAKALKTLRGVFIDCGWRDQYNIHYGARQLSLGLTQAGVKHTYEEFDDNHSSIDYRMDVSLPFLYKALAT
jgi:enterochelin esterase-like enzyme